MVSPRWSKVIRDLWINKARTALIVISIAVGVFAVGTTIGAYFILDREMTSAYQRANPAEATLFTSPFDEELIVGVHGMREVREAQGRRSLTVRMAMEDGAWRDLQLFAFRDYDDIGVMTVTPEVGAWPPPRREMLIERAAVQVAGVGPGEAILVETPTEKRRILPVTGVVHDIHQFPAGLSGQAYGYVTFSTLEWLGEGAERQYNTLHLILEGENLTREQIRSAAEKVRDRMEKSGATVDSLYTPPPGRHPASDFLEPMLLILGVLGFLSLLLAGLLVTNTISALLKQQVRQIGVMKAVGARGFQISLLYLCMVFVLGLLGLGVGMPLGALAARGFSGFMAGLINFDIATFRVPVEVVAAEVVVGLLVPLLAAVPPILDGARITVREAMTSHGVGQGSLGASWIDRLISSLRGLPRPVLLSLRNTFRRKGRLVLSLAALALGGALFISVMSVNQSLGRTLDDTFAYYGYDVDLTFARPYRVADVEDAVLSVPGVTAAESRGEITTRRVRPDDTEGPDIKMLGLPSATRMVNPILLQGRWLLPEDENAVVINADFVYEEPDVAVGDTIELVIHGRESPWRVVGLVRGANAGPIVYANYPYFSGLGRHVGRADTVKIVSDSGSRSVHQALITDLEESLKMFGMRVSSSRTIADERDNIQMQFDILIGPMVIMALLVGTVGGLGLSGLLSMNVLERTREIGVMRAVGASNGAVRGVVLVEGIVVGLMSCVLGTLLSLPMSRFLSDAVGVAFLQTPLIYTFAQDAVWIWLVIVLVLATIASLLPARHAARLSVRETLAYE